MKHVKKSVLIWYSPMEMYELVTGVRHYPQFLPWCERADVIDESPESMVARLHLAYAGVRHAFTTRNRHAVGERVVVELVDGPFSVLDGTWDFRPIAMPSGDGSTACRIEFDLRYAFSSRALEAVVSPVFDRVANTFVDSFVKRAESVYGAR